MTARGRQPGIWGIQDWAGLKHHVAEQNATRPLDVDNAVRAGLFPLGAARTGQPEAKAALSHGAYFCFDKTWFVLESPGLSASVYARLSQLCAQGVLRAANSTCVTLGDRNTEPASSY
jgi:hypothetical protein